MAGPHEPADARAGMALGPVIRFALRPAPRRFGAANFAIRLAQHLIVYIIFLITAVYGCLFVFAPAEMLLLSLAGIFVMVVVVSLFSSSGQKLRRLAAGGIAAIYIAGAAALLRAVEAVSSLLFLHRM